MKNIIWMSLVTLGLSACTMTAKSLETSGFTKMKGTEIRSALAGNTLRGTDSSGKYVIYYTSGSTMKIVHHGRKRIRRDTGHWRIAGDRYCRKWTSLGKGKERCVNLYKNGKLIHWVQNNKITDKSVLLRGNPAGL